MKVQYIPLAATLVATMFLLTPACGDDDDVGGVLPTATRQAQTSGENIPSAKDGKIEVVASSESFAPQRFAVPVGKPVIISVKNSDPFEHTLKIANGPTTGTIAPGATGSLTLTPQDRGGLNFFCEIHGQAMRGRIVIQ